MKRAKSKNIINSFLIALFFVAFAISAIQLFKIFSGYKAGRDEYEAVSELAVAVNDSSEIYENTEESFFTEDVRVVSGSGQSDFSIDYTSLKELNGDFIAWIDIPGTSISYPITCCSNNDYYLIYTFLGNYNAAGCIFMDYRTSSFELEHVIIYGHRMNDGSMFADLKKYLDYSFLSVNKEIFIYTETEILSYEIFAARKVSATDECYTYSFINRSSYEVWLNKMSNYSISPSKQFPDDKVITLSTCVYNDKASRIIVQAYLVDRQPII